MRKFFNLTLLLVLFSLVLTACGSPTPAAPAQPEETFKFGMLMVGPYNDRGYSQAHYEGGKYVEEKIPGTEMLYVDKVNPADRPGTTPAQLAEDLVSKGAKLIIFNSDDMKDSALEFTADHPEIIVMHPSGDSAWKDGKEYKDLPNIGNVFGRMVYGKMMAGCAAALTTKTGQIGYLGPLINDETRRLASAAYLGADYCWQNYMGKDSADLKFKVTWIGFWFNIPGVTSDPTQVANDFFNTGYDVVLSGIDTTEGITEAKKRAAEGKEVWGIPYDFIGSCEEGKDICLGVPYFNWGPAYVEVITAAKSGTWKPDWVWLAPDWKDINNPDSSIVGFYKGDALSPEASTSLDKFIAELAGGLSLFSGPLNYQDGSPFLSEGQTASDQQIWYLQQLLEGMEGQSVSQ
ncbi:MAG: BMP family ABC transporter substrate-binding protein [Anaerolineales bacterium]|jgi:simple sugar transport system substrate-binding protein|nr:BMP family ABC transporter substrate-binding protein [Anaerolineales bacterium]